jgi:tetratricopeptide (TPR) repeat protein
MARVPEIEYSFRNPMTQEAVYKTILLKRRREFHRRVGEAMVELYPDRLEGLYGLLAHHFALAGEREKAIEYSRKAAKQAMAVYAYDDAAQNLRAALELIPLGEMSAIHLSLREECADIFCLLRDGARAIAEYQQALELWRGLQDSDRMAGVRLHRKIVQAVTDLKWSVSLENLQRANAAREDSRASLVRALDQLEGEPPYLETVRARIALSADAWRIQEPPDWDTAQRFAQAAVDMAAALDSPVDLSQAHGALANVLDGRSRLREHLQMAEQRLAICRQPEFSDLRETLEALRGLGTALMYVGEYAQALPYLAEAEGLATRVQAVDQIANILTVQAQCLFRTDRWDEVLALEEKWRDLERRHTRERVGATCFLVALSASVHALRGDTDRANTYAQESYDFMVSISGKPEKWQRNQFY